MFHFFLLKPAKYFYLQCGEIDKIKASLFYLILKKVLKLILIKQDLMISNNIT